MLRLSLICVFLVASTLAIPISYYNNGAGSKLSFHEKRLNIGAGASREDDDGLVSGFVSDPKSAVSTNTDAAIRGDPLNGALAKNGRPSPDLSNGNTNPFSSLGYNERLRDALLEDGRFSLPPP